MRVGIAQEAQTQARTAGAAEASLTRQNLVLQQRCELLHSDALFHVARFSVSLGFGYLFAHRCQCMSRLFCVERPIFVCWCRLEEAEQRLARATAALAGLSAAQTAVSQPVTPLHPLQV